MRLQSKSKKRRYPVTLKLVAVGIDHYLRVRKEKRCKVTTHKNQTTVINVIASIVNFGKRLMLRPYQQRDSKGGDAYMSCSIELYKHQQDALTKSEKFNNVAYWHDM